MPTSRKLIYNSSLSCSGFSPQLYSMKPCEIKVEDVRNTTRELVIASVVIGQKFCGKIEQRGR